MSSPTHTLSDRHATMLASARDHLAQAARDAADTGNEQRAINLALEVANISAELARHGHNTLATY